MELTALVADRATRSLCSATKLVSAGYRLEMNPDELHENPVAVALILLEELCDLVRHEVRGVRDEELFHCTQR